MFLFVLKSSWASSSRLAIKMPTSEKYILNVSSSALPFNGSSGKLRLWHSFTIPDCSSQATQPSNHLILRLLQLLISETSYSLSQAGV